MLTLAALSVPISACYLITPYSDLTSGEPSDGLLADAGRESSSSSDGAGFCERLTTPATFCDDFEGTKLLTQNWTNVSVSPNGTLVIDPSAGVPPPSLQSAVPADGQTLAYVARDFDLNRELSISFDARADLVGGGTEQVTLLVFSQRDPGGAMRKVLYYVTASGAEIEEELSQPFQNWPKGLPGPPVIGEWTHYDLAFSIENEATSKLTLAIDGVVVLDGVTLGQAWSPGQYELAMGLSWTNASRAAWGFHFDNVVVRTR